MVGSYTVVGLEYTLQCFWREIRDFRIYTAVIWVVKEEHQTEKFLFLL